MSIKGKQVIRLLRERRRSDLRLMDERYRQQMSQIHLQHGSSPSYVVLVGNADSRSEEPHVFSQPITEQGSVPMQDNNGKQNVWQGTLLLMFASGFAVIAVLILVVLGVLLAGTFSGSGVGGSVSAIP